MYENFDFESIVANFIIRIAPNLYRFGSTLIESSSKKNEEAITNTYSAYLIGAAERYGKAKSFFIQDTPTSLYDFYVPVRISSGDLNLPKVSLNDIFCLTKHAVITASAGAGKSMLLRHLFIDAIRNSDRVPVFIELRRINDSNFALLDEIVSELESFGFDLGEEYIKKGIAQGQFVLFLDGYDEVKDDLRNELNNQIDVLSKYAPECILVISSRHDETFSRWEDFREFSVEPLSLNEACELVEKLPYDEVLKDKFISDLRSSLYGLHKSFLSNPLLLSIMLLTYGESADIPQKLSLFYNQAYESLLYRHDARKGGFKRDRRTALDTQDFARIFSAFCLRTYDAHKFSFTRLEVLEYLEKAIANVEMVVNTQDFLDDCLKAVCLLMEDGLNITFSHRSFQEYFVARYIRNADPAVQKKLLTRFESTIRMDNVYSLLYEMNPDLVERELLVPRLNEILGLLKVKRKFGITHFYRFLNRYFTSVHIMDEAIRYRHRVADESYIREFDVDIFVFAYRHCVLDHVVSKTDKRIIRDLKLTLADHDERLDLDTVSYRSPIIEKLSKVGGIFGVDGLNSVVRLTSRLEQKHNTVQESLDELLN